MPARLARVLLAATFAASLALFLAPVTPDAGALPDVPGVDKLAHAVTFALLAALARVAFPRAPRMPLMLTLVAYALLTEAAQAPLPGRTADAWDFLADVGGILIGTALARRRARAPAR